MNTGLFVEIDRDLKKQFKSEVSSMGSTVKDEITEFIKNFISEKRKKEKGNGGRKYC